MGSMMQVLVVPGWDHTGVPAASAVWRALSLSAPERRFCELKLGGGHTLYARHLIRRPRIEPAFGWLKTIGWIRKVKLRGLAKVDWLFRFASAAFNLRRLVTLRAVPA